MTQSPLRLGIAGLGTVGAGVVRILQRHEADIAARAGRPVEIVAVSARTRDKDRGVRLNAYAWEDDPVALARRDDIDVFVELVGGADGPAKAAAEAAFAAGKDLVTANKAMLAIHGQAMAEAAEAAGATIKFEAAVAGGIPAVKALREGLAGNEITRVMGVMNGTCNYMLTRMEGAHLAYDTVFDECQKLGYLEADPSLDVGGIDSEVMGRIPGLVDTFQWALAIAICEEFVVLEQRILEFLRTEAARGRLPDTRSAELFDEEEIKHVKLFRRMADALKALDQVLSGQADLLSSPLGLLSASLYAPAPTAIRDEIEVDPEPTDLERIRRESAARKLGQKYEVQSPHDVGGGGNVCDRFVQF